MLPRRWNFVRVLLCFCTALLLVSGFAPGSFAAFIELHSPVTYNMQGSATGNGSKWTSDVLPLSNNHDIVALQEAGASTPGVEFSRSSTNEGLLIQYKWNVGTNANPDYRYIYWLQTDPSGNRVNLAIVTHVPANAVTTVQGGIPGVSRGALGVRLGLSWFYTVHGLASGGGDDAQLLANIAGANVTGFFWTALGDFNRDPSTLSTPFGAIKYTSGQATQQSGGELDYMVSSDDVTCDLYSYQVKGNRLGGLSSDHYPVETIVSGCNDPGPTLVGPLRVMCAGDGVVAGGQAAGTLGGFRPAFQTDLTLDRFSWNFVGTQQSGNLADPYHEAFPGAEIADLDSPGVIADVETIKPNVVTFVVGAEDIINGDNVSTAPARLAALVRDYAGADPDATMIIATMPPLNGFESEVASFNNSLPGIVQQEQQSGLKVLLADMGSITSSDFTYPTATATGYQQMADAFNSSILTAVNVGWLNHPISCGSASYCGPNGGGTGGSDVCDIYGSGAEGTYCVAAHSTVRPLFSSYTGKLYQVQRASDNTTTDINVSSATGYADGSAQTSFCANTTCTITTIYDQTSNHNDLTVSNGTVIVPSGGTLPNNDTGAVANALPITVHGNAVFGVLVTPGVGYRNNATTGVPKGSQAEGMYMVTSGTFVNDGCCFDYGNAEVTLDDTGAGHMDALNFGTFCMYQPCSGSGPWVEADLENGQYMGNGANPSNPSSGTDFVTAMLDNNGTSTFTLKSGDATTGGLTTGYSGSLPTVNPGYIPMSKEGGLVLGTGGDNSHAGQGSFFEGAVVAGLSLIHI